MMEKKKTYLSQLWHDFWHLNELMPLSIDIIEDEENQVYAWRVVNPPNQYVPEFIEEFKDKKKGIYRFKMRNHLYDNNKLLEDKHNEG